MQMTYDGSILTIRAIWHYDLLQPVRRHQSMMSNDSRSKEKWNEKQQPLGGREDVKFGHLFYSKIAPNLPWAMERGRSGQKLRICGPEWQLGSMWFTGRSASIRPILACRNFLEDRLCADRTHFTDNRNSLHIWSTWREMSWSYC